VKPPAQRKPLLFRITHIGRGLDARLPATRFAFAATLLAGATAAGIALAAGDGWANVLWEAFIAGASAFMGWALTRELDPDLQWTSMVAAALAGIAGAAFVSGWGGNLLANPSVGLTAVVLIAARIQVGTVGLEPMLRDAVVVGAVAAALSRGDRANWLTAIAFCLALIGVTRRTGDRRFLFVAGATVLAATVLAWGDLTAIGDTWRLPVAIEWWVSALGLSGGLVAWVRTPQPAATCDATRAPITAGRLRTARGGLLILSVAIIALGGGHDVVAIVVLLVAQLAVGVGSLVPERLDR
jgi:hypothetical protein